MLTKRIHNIDSITHSYEGQQIASGATYEIQPLEETRWANSAPLLSDIGAALVRVNDGSGDITDVNAAINYLKSQIPQEVVTLFEKNDKDLKMASGASPVNVTTGEAIVEIPCPEDGRWMDEGISFFTDVEPNRVKSIEGIAAMDLPADALYPGSPPIPEGTPLKSYHDDDLPEENQGWRVPATAAHLAVGDVTCDTLAGYGWVPGIIRLKIKGQKSGVAPFSGWFAVNIKWGKQT